MPFFINRNFENQLYEYFASMQAWNNVRPVNLGGVSNPSGTGGPPGGFVGQLPQNRVTYDFIEAASNYTPMSGMSILDNLNHIRYDIENMAAGAIEVQWDDSIIGSGITVLNFEGNVSVTTASGIATITIISTASGMPAGNSVVYEREFSQSPASGTSNSYSRADHTHGTPYQPSREIIFTISESLFPVTGNLRMYNQLGVNFHINKVFLAVSTPPSGASIRADINKNGTSIFTSEANQPIIPNCSGTGYSTNIDLPDFNNGDYLTLDLDQVGTSIPGSNLTAHVTLVDTNI